MRAAPLLVMLSTCVRCAACAPRGSQAVPPVEVTIAPVSAPAPLSIAASSPKHDASDRCSARLRPAKIKTAANCQLDERLTRGPGVLVFPCAGADGDAEAIFGEHHFVGNVSGGVLILDLSTELDWDDGCHWQTRQGIRGGLPPGSRTKLSWTYTERPVAGVQCAGSCTAQADIDVEMADTAVP